MTGFKNLLTFLFIVIGLSCQSQVKISEINFNRIPHKTIRNFLKIQQSQNIYSLVDIKPSMQPNSSYDGYRTDERIYLVKDSLAKVWQHYLHTNPGDSWNGDRLSFGLLLSKKENKIVYRGENVSQLDTGQVVFLNLKLFKGFANLAAVFQFISIDVKKRIMEFSYINGNITKGKQHLQFVETKKGYTEIVHTTFYRSSSWLRDKLLYPYFHTRMINEFHRNMKKLYRTQKAREISTPQDFTNPDRVFSESNKWREGSAEMR